MPLKALLIPDNLTDSDSDGIGLGTSCNFIYISWPGRFTLRGRTWPKGVKFTVDEHLGYRNFE